MMGITIAIDFDGTIKRSSQDDGEEMRMWTEIILAFARRGHRVIICTMRKQIDGDSDINRYCRTFGYNIGQEIPVVYCGEKGLKKDVCRELGYKVDIWIDDMPWMIENRPPLIRGEYTLTIE